MENLPLIQFQFKIREVEKDIEEFNYEMTHFNIPPSNQDVTMAAMNVTEKISKVVKILSFLPMNERKKYIKQVGMINKQFKVRLEFYKKLYL